MWSLHGKKCFEAISQGFGGKNSFSETEFMNVFRKFGSLELICQKLTIFAIIQAKVKFFIVKLPF